MRNREVGFGVLVMMAVSMLVLGVQSVEAQCCPFEQVWELAGKASANVKKVGKVQAPGGITVVFGPNIAEGLAEGEFKVIDPQGDSFTGTYEICPTCGGAIAELTVEETSLEAYLATKIEEAATAAGLDVVINEIVIDTEKGTAKPTATSWGYNLSVSIKVKATVGVTIGGVETTIKVALSVKGKGTLEVGIAGTEWTIEDAAVKANVKALGSESNRMGLDVILGPNTEYGLDEGEFLVVDDEANQFGGTYEVDKNKVICDVNEDELEDFLFEHIDQYIAHEFDIEGFAELLSVGVTDVTVKVTAKADTSINIVVTIDFSGSVSIMGIIDSSTGTLKVRGKGVPAV